MRRKTKLKGKIYKHTLPALRLSVPEDFNIKWISLRQNPDRARELMPSVRIAVKAIKRLCKSDDSKDSRLGVLVGGSIKCSEAAETSARSRGTMGVFQT